MAKDRVNDGPDAGQSEAPVSKTENRCPLHANPATRLSIIRRGEIGALVYATGGKTYFGKTYRQPFSESR
jgi:hypothetical protein